MLFKRVELKYLCVLIYTQIPVIVNLSQNQAVFSAVLGDTLMLYCLFLSKTPLPDNNVNHAQPCLFASGTRDTAAG